jgi:hypothetical protein
VANKVTRSLSRNNEAEGMNRTGQTLLDEFGLDGNTLNLDARGFRNRLTDDTVSGAGTVGQEYQQSSSYT